MDRAEIRKDFIRRLFAVAISVGFATTLVRMDWVEKGDLPAGAEIDQLFILFLGLIVTVLSWDGYLASIEKKPLNGDGRFWIDIALVFIYMFLLISSKQSDFWLFTLVVIYVLYAAWDFLTVREHMVSYNKELVPSAATSDDRAPLRQILRVYADGFKDRTGIDRGPISTFSWALFFIFLWLIHRSLPTVGTIGTCLFAISGLALYRYDKRKTLKGQTVRGFSMPQRAILVVVILVLYGSVSLYLR
jgi:hypothetical protein